MGIDIGGNTIVKNSLGFVSLNSLVFSPQGHGSASTGIGYSAWKAGSTYYSGATGWEINQSNWNGGGLNPALNGIFTCPVTGFYAMGYDSIHNGGSGWPAGQNTYGYSCFAKNGAMSYHTHWNGDSRNGWMTGGCSALFSCVAGDTLALFVNSPPAPGSPNGVAQNMGMYPNSHHSVWCKLIG